MLWLDPWKLTNIGRSNCIQIPKSTLFLYFRKNDNINKIWSPRLPSVLSNYSWWKCFLTFLMINLKSVKAETTRQVFTTVSPVKMCTHVSLTCFFSKQCRKQDVWTSNSGFAWLCRGGLSILAWQFESWPLRNRTLSRVVRNKKLTIEITRSNRKHINECSVNVRCAPSKVQDKSIKR